ncbi:DUF6384 family protein [Thiorhodovibrio frisius]|uniref:Uncharacterized protein n=1 Tax=Thiorhodovibrio frisius TaxID=631362 RepID=H8Z763_9GAMM|nr:DUF6384 family protein [Thiorhodovibrio frisius]EIC20862.1 hypothetical protein Thi970DRAFT_04531 [Thiorhodovibrio frisius]WPL21917.1 hypothetical protein Thiofri_02056 [Thiorhodovibrio frisius]
MSAQTSSAVAAPLDDLMLAMDVVDTLRRRERLVKRELDGAGREQDLKDRLHKIYHAQGIEVSDQILEEGVAALKEDRFVYKPPVRSLAVTFAWVYVSRGRWGKWLLGGLTAVIAAWALNYVIFVAPDAALPHQLAEVHAETIAIAQSGEARARAEQLLETGQAAARSGDTDAARQALAALDAMQSILRQEYSLRILNRPGEQTGVWRIPDINTQARNYYIIVEAVDLSGGVLRVPITNEETGKTEMVTAWGLRVDKPVFDAVARDKQDDGIIEHNSFGQKARGALTPSYEMRTTGGAITQW